MTEGVWLDGREDEVAVEDESAAIETRGLVVRYGRKTAVDGLSLTVPRGSVYAFLGLNGAGKTTTIKTLLGLRRSSGGEARVFGYDVSDPKEGIEARARIGFAGEWGGLYEGMTVGRMLAFCKSVSRRWNEAEIDHYLDLFGLPRRVRIGSFSRGQKAQFQLCLALGSDPELLILDEPTAGLDPVARHTFLKALVGGAAVGGRTVFFSTHVLSEVEAVADRVGIIRGGRLVVEGELDHLRETHRAFRLIYDEVSPEEEIEALRSVSGVTTVEREGRSVRVGVRGDVEAVSRVLEERPYALRDVDSVGVSLEEILLGYMKEESRDR